MMNALLPAFIDASERRGRRDALALYGSVQIRVLLILIAFAAALAAFAGPLLRALATAFDDEKIRLTANLMFIMLPVLPLSALNVCWRALLNADERFAVAAISPAMAPLFTVAGLFFLTRSYGIYTLAIGTTAGALVESLMLLCYVHASGGPVMARQTDAAVDARRVFAQYLPAAASNLVMGSSALVDQSMAATLGPGSISTLNYGTRLVTVLLAIGPVALSTVFLPWFSRMTAKGDSTGVRDAILRYSLLSLAITIPATLVLAGTSKWLVELFFQRGAFTSADTDTVARVQACALVRLPLSVLLALLLPMVASLKRNSLLLSAAVLNLTANVLLNLLFMRMLGVAGLALSTAAVHLVTVLYLANRLLKTT
jgi:putative peptidoglycan lipid II flippase